MNKYIVLSIVVFLCFGLTLAYYFKVQNFKTSRIVQTPTGLNIHPGINKDSNKTIISGKVKKITSEKIFISNKNENFEVLFSPIENDVILLHIENSVLPTEQSWTGKSIEDLTKIKLYNLYAIIEVDNKDELKFKNIQVNSNSKEYGYISRLILDKRHK